MQRCPDLDFRWPTGFPLEEPNSFLYTAISPSFEDARGAGLLENEASLKPFLPVKVSQNCPVGFLAISLGNKEVGAETSRAKSCCITLVYFKKRAKNTLAHALKQK